MSSLEIPMLIGLAIVAAGLYLFWILFRRKVTKINNMPDLPEVIGKNGFEVPVLATFKGLKKASRKTSYAHNSLIPELTLYNDRLECRVLREKSIPYSQIENIDIWDAIATRNLIVSVRDREMHSQQTSLAGET